MRRKTEQFYLYILFLSILLSGSILPAQAQETQPNNDLVFNEITATPNTSNKKIIDKTKSIVKIETQTNLGKEKTSTGSGFLASTDGHIITNYHVISHYLFSPQYHKIIILFQNEAPLKATLEAVDIVNDLAVLKIDSVPPDTQPITIRKTLPKIGEMVYSIGYPHGWDLTILTGLFNNLVTSKFSPQYVLSNALSPGMSGGATLDSEGLLVAVNVAATNKLSLVIPAEKVDDLLKRLNTNKNNNKEKLTQIKETALKEYEDTINNVIEDIKKSEIIDIGSFRLPIKNQNFNCWSEQNQKPREKTNILITARNCQTKDSFFLNTNSSIGETSINVAHYKNNGEHYLLYKHLINSKFTILSNQKPHIEKCSYINATNSNQNKNNLTDIAVCIQPLKTNNKLFSIRITTLYSKFNEHLILNFEADGLSHKHILNITNFIKNI